MFRDLGPISVLPESHEAGSPSARVTGVPHLVEVIFAMSDGPDLLLLPSAVAAEVLF